MSARTYNVGVTKCAGTCGRMLRSSRTTREDFPGTVSRHAHNMCRKCCAQADIKAKEQEAAIRPCKNCDHPTRPQRMRSHDAPGTLKRIGDLCQRCDTHIVWVAPQEVTATVESLDAYIRSRRSRGIPPEGLNYLKVA